jgi:hypothetical protein
MRRPQLAVSLPSLTQFERSTPMPNSDERREAAIEAAAEALYAKEPGSNRRPWEGRGVIYKQTWLDDARTVRDAYDTALGADEPERLAAIEACDSIRELIAKFAHVGDKQAGEWLDRHLKTIRSVLDWPLADAPLGGHVAADMKAERDELANRLVAERDAHLEQEQQLRAALGGEAESELQSLYGELATILGPGKPREGETRAAYWLRRIGAALSEHPETGEREARSVCPRCGTDEYAEVRNRVPEFGEGEVWCTRCNQKIRDWDSG